MLLLIPGIIFLSIGLINLGIELFLRLNCKEKTIGTLCEREEHLDYNRYMPRTKCYSPVYSFMVKGKEYKVSPKKYYTDPLECEIGATAEIKYCAGNPSICLINNKSDKLGIIIICLVFGALLCFLAIR